MPTRPSAPLAAIAGVLAALAVLVLAQPRGSAPAAPPREDPPAPPAASPARQRLLADEPIDVNTAQASDLELLPRIGPQLAARIVEDRDRGGPFRSVADLARVRGIGPRTVERLRPLVTVAGDGVAP